MNFFKKLFSDVQDVAATARDPEAGTAAIEKKMREFKMLANSLDFQWKRLNAEWKKASSIEENLKRTPMMRAQSLRRAKALARRMGLIGKISGVVGTFSDVLQQSLELKKHAIQMKKAAGDLEQLKALGGEMDKLMAQNEAALSGLGELQNKLEYYQSRMEIPGDPLETQEKTRLDELYEKLETCMGEGDMAEVERIQKEIDAAVNAAAGLQPA